MRRAATVAGVVAAVLAAAPPAGAQTLFRITDPRIDEASGLAVGLRSPGVLYVQNDSGDTNRFFALDARTGRTAATVTVTGARNVDWEDLAVARDAAGTPSVWLADIGDNDAERREIRIYRVREPELDPGTADRRISTGPAAVWRLRYPDGAQNAESLAVAPGGTAYVVTKSFFGASVVYRVPADPDASRVQTLRRVATVGLRPTGTPGGPDPIGQLTATGAAFSRDGTVLAVRTYTDAYLWRVADGDVAAALRATPRRVALPAQPLGEGVAIDGRRLLLDSEGVGRPVLSVPLPALPAMPTTRSPGSSSGRPASAPPAADDAGGPSPGTGTVLAGAAVLLAGAAGAVTLLVRRRRRGRPAPGDR